MPRQYPIEFRRKVLDLVEAATPIAEIAEQLEVDHPPDLATVAVRILDRVGLGVGS